MVATATIATHDPVDLWSPEISGLLGIESGALMFYECGPHHGRTRARGGHPMSNLTLWTRRDPFTEFDSLVRRAFGPVATAPVGTGFVPAAEVTRDGDDAVVSVELPGVDVAKDVTVEVDGDRLVVRGERRDQRSEQRDGRTVREVRYGS